MRKARYSCVRRVRVRRLSMLVAMGMVVIVLVTMLVVVVHKTYEDCREEHEDEGLEEGDEELQEQWSEFQTSVRPADPALDPGSLEQRARRFLDSQTYHARSRIFAVQVPGRPVVTNERRVVDREELLNRPGRLRDLAERYPNLDHFELAQEYERLYETSLHATTVQRALNELGVYRIRRTDAAEVAARPARVRALAKRHPQMSCECSRRCMHSAIR